MKILCDQSAQTDTTSHKQFAGKRFWNIQKCILLTVISYVGLCLLAAHSSNFKTIFVYMHYFRNPFQDPTNLQSVGLSSNTRSIQIEFSSRTVNDSSLTVLHGYHLLPPRILYDNPSKFIISPHSSQHYIFNYSAYEEELLNADRIVVFFHGAAGSRATHYRISLIKKIAEALDAHVITFDYRGFADSIGWPSEESVLEDSIECFRFLHRILHKRIQTNDNKPLQLYIYGQSLGTAISSEIATYFNAEHRNKLLPEKSTMFGDLSFFDDLQLTGIVLECGFTTLKEAAPYHPNSFLFRLVPTMLRYM